MQRKIGNLSELDFLLYEDTEIGVYEIKRVSCVFKVSESKLQ